MQFAYLINAVLAFSAALPFIIIFKAESRQEQQKEDQSTETAKLVRRKIQVLLVIVLCIISALATAVVERFSGYLTTFGLLHLKWSQDYGSSMTSLYFAMYAVGSLLGAFILRFISSRSFIHLSYIASIGSLFLFYSGVCCTIAPLQYIPTAAFGLSSSAILPATFTWIQEPMTPVYGISASTFLVAGSVGSMANPVLLVFFMENVTPMWFLYLAIFEISLSFILFSGAVLMVRKLRLDGDEPNQIKTNQIVLLSITRI